MNEIPKMVSTKDLAYFEDMMNWTMIFSKKCNMYKNLVTDSDVKEKIMDVANMVTNQYECTLELLK